MPVRDRQTKNWIAAGPVVILVEPQLGDNVARRRAPWRIRALALRLSSA